MSSSSITPLCAFPATGEVSWVRTTMPSVQAMVQEAAGLRWPSISTMHCRQAPTGSSSGWSQKRGISTPTSSAARMTSVPLGTDTGMPSTVTETRSPSGGAPVDFAVTVMRAPPGATGRPTPWTSPGRRGSPGP
ncbi:hypothetical protein GCM10020221_17780 [Streptomyces thioluteus]|uniref:Uncharacterized protein n=1 Tax=Streptomyces thioluteus TaxID=66431 RepID=A0ABN3WPN7_STRTU